MSKYSEKWEPVWKWVGVVFISISIITMIWGQFEPYSETMTVLGDQNCDTTCEALRWSSIASSVVLCTMFGLFIAYYFFGRKSNTMLITLSIFVLLSITSQVLITTYTTIETDDGESRDIGYSFTLISTVLVICLFLFSPPMISIFERMAGGVKYVIRPSKKSFNDVTFTETMTTVTEIPTVQTSPIENNSLTMI